jgi:hypothetical protein
VVASCKSLFDSRRADLARSTEKPISVNSRMFSSDGSAEKNSSKFILILSQKEKVEDISKQSKKKDFWYYKVNQPGFLNEYDQFKPKSSGKKLFSCLCL